MARENQALCLCRCIDDADRVQSEQTTGEQWRLFTLPVPLASVL